MAKKSQRTIVASPLTPTLLYELDALRNFSPPSVDFKPDGNWVNTYRIWTCHGYRESGNENVGYLQIKRLIDSDSSIVLKVHQEVLQADALVNIIDATILCWNDKLTSPSQWRVSSQFIDSDSKPISQLSINETGSTGNSISSDFSLFEAVQRLEFNRQTSLNFDMLEGLSLLKEDQHLSYKQRYLTKIGDKNISLHCFFQLGSGILPTEYWLDKHHRLLIVTSMNKAYIFDEQAEKITRQIIEQERKSFKRRKSSRRK